MAGVAHEGWLTCPGCASVLAPAYPQGGKLMTCDGGCGRKLPVGRVNGVGRLRCTPCNYDVCFDCRDRLLTPQALPRTRVKLGPPAWPSWLSRCQNDSCTRERGQLTVCAEEAERATAVAIEAMRKAEQRAGVQVDNVQRLWDADRESLSKSVKRERCRWRQLAVVAAEFKEQAAYQKSRLASTSEALAAALETIALAKRRERRVEQAEAAVTKREAAASRQEASARAASRAMEACVVEAEARLAEAKAEAEVAREEAIEAAEDARVEVAAAAKLQSEAEGARNDAALARSSSTRSHCATHTSPRRHSSCVCLGLAAARTTRAARPASSAQISPASTRSSRATARRLST